MKKFQPIGVLLSAITLLLVVLLGSIFTYSAEQAYARRDAAERVLKTVDVLRHVYVADDALHSEQGAINTAFTMSSLVRPQVKTLIRRLHREVAAAITATCDTSRIESGGAPRPTARIRKVLLHYRQRYALVLRAPDARPAKSGHKAELKTGPAR